MKKWKQYNNQRWLIDICRDKVAELRASNRFLRVKVGAPMVYHGKRYYHILVIPKH